MIRPYTGRFRTSCLPQRDPDFRASPRQPAKTDALLVYLDSAGCTTKFGEGSVAEPGLVGRSRLRDLSRGTSDETSRAPPDRQTVRPPAEPLDVPGHDLGNHALKLRQILYGRRMRRPYGSRGDRLVLNPARPAPSSAGRPALLGQNILRQIVGRYLHASLRRLGILVERRNHIRRPEHPPAFGRARGPQRIIRRWGTPPNRTSWRLGTRLITMVRFVHGRVNLLVKTEATFLLPFLSILSAGSVCGGEKFLGSQTRLIGSGVPFVPARSLECV